MALFSFPDPVNEVSARLVAAGVVVMSLAAIVFGQPSKRFAQGMGAVFSTTAAVLGLALALHTAAYVVLGLLVVAATLESVFALCIGCKIFALLMRAGVIPERICERCVPIPA